MNDDDLTQFIQLGQQDVEDDIELLSLLVSINSWSQNLEGLKTVLQILKEGFRSLNPEMEEFKTNPLISINDKGEQLAFPLGNVLFIHKHPQANQQILLAGHMDTVFHPEHPFQKPFKKDQNTLIGPGSADMKGGLIIILRALKLLENSPYAGKLGWGVFINPDEEIGSVGSRHLLEAFAPKFHWGLIFEPALPDGFLASQRKGSLNYTIVVKGRSAHAGRDFEHGRNAITFLCRLCGEIEKLSDFSRGLTINIGHIVGGGATNIVPDHALCRLNIRMTTPEDFKTIQDTLHEIIAQHQNYDGIQIKLFENSSRPPKIPDPTTEKLFEALQNSAKQLNLDLQWKPTGGVCDGNLLADYGLPNIDNLGVRGGHLHTDQEFVMLDSLVERSTLTALFLMGLAAKAITLPGGN